MQIYTPAVLRGGGRGEGGLGEGLMEMEPLPRVF